MAHKWRNFHYFRLKRRKNGEYSAKVNEYTREKKRYKEPRNSSGERSRKFVKNILLKRYNPLITLRGFRFIFFTDETPRTICSPLSLRVKTRKLNFAWNEKGAVRSSTKNKLGVNRVVEWKMHCGRLLRVCVSSSSAEIKEKSMVLVITARERK